MPPPPVPAREVALTRRTALVGAALGLAGLSGCTLDRRPRRRRGRGGEEPTDEPEAAPQEQVDPDVAVASLALEAEQSMLAALEATVDRHRRLAETLAPLVSAHTAHVALLADAAPSRPEQLEGQSPGSPSASPPSSPSSPDGTSGARSGSEGLRVPGRAPAALRRLVVLEQELSTTDKRHAFVAQSGAFARLLAGMAASAAQNAAVLEAAVAERSGR